MNVQHQVSIIARQMIGELPMRDGAYSTVESNREFVAMLGTEDLKAIRREIGVLRGTTRFAMAIAALKTIDAELMKRAPDGVGANVSLEPQARYTLQDRRIYENGVPIVTLGLYHDENNARYIAPSDADELFRRIVHLLNEKG